MERESKERRGRRRQMEANWIYCPPADAGIRTMDIAEPSTLKTFFVPSTLTFEWPLWNSAKIVSLFCAIFRIWETCGGGELAADILGTKKGCRERMVDARPLHH